MRPSSSAPHCPAAPHLGVLGELCTEPMGPSPLEGGSCPHLWPPRAAQPPWEAESPPPPPPRPHPAPRNPTPEAGREPPRSPALPSPPPIPKAAPAAPLSPPPTSRSAEDAPRRQVGRQRSGPSRRGPPRPASRWRSSKPRPGSGAGRGGSPSPDSSCLSPAAKRRAATASLGRHQPDQRRALWNPQVCTSRGRHAFTRAEKVTLRPLRRACSPQSWKSGQSRDAMQALRLGTPAKP